VFKKWKVHPVRQWPSFNANWMDFDPDAITFDSDETFVFTAKGELCPDDLIDFPLPWYRLRLADGTVVWALQNAVSSIE
jgi:hypothetical protein